MTVESYAQAPAYTISGVGPYPIPHPYLAGTIVAYVLIEDVPTQLDVADFSIDPATAVGQGNLLLTAAAATTHDGQTLWIERATPLEQGWMARDDGREAGMEAQLDQDVMGAQEDRAQINAALRARKPMAAFDPRPNRVPMVRADGLGWENGPTADEVEAAQGYAEAAKASAARIDLGALDAAVQATTDDALATAADREQTGLDRQAAESAASTAAADANAQIAPNVAAAEAAEAAAVAAQGSAESARDAATVNAEVYTDIASGLAATADAEQFQVVTGDVIVRYRNDGGATATEVARYPSATYAQDTRFDLDEAREPLARYTGSDDLVPLFTDASGRVLLGVNKQTGRLTTDGDVERVLGGLSQAKYIGSGPVWPLVADASGRVLLGVNEMTGEVVGALSGGIDATSFSVEELSAPVDAAEYNHLLFYGQSLSVGAASGSVISVSQPYSNVTFNGGPRAWDGAAFDFSAFKPLVEDAVSPAPDGGTNRQETPCSGAANFASTVLAADGIAPTDHVILASTAGHGSYRIDQLDKASAWYPNLIAHVTGAQALNSDHAVHALCWMQGENDISVSTLYQTYYDALERLQADVETDVQSETGQTSPVYCLTYQVSFGAAVHSDIALAHLNLAQKSNRFFLSTPMYHFPYTAGVHLTAEGYKWAGAYFGRAYAEIVQGRKPRWLNPVSATRRGAEIRVRFQVPTLPLVLDTTTLAVTTDYGFQVTDDGSPAAISNIAVQGSDVVITLAAAPSGTVTVRYALDHLGAGLTITNGASGNLRDSTPDAITISGTPRPLYHVSPAFELAAITLGE
ncbi:hypothetical protein BMG03_01100 [Thioclava nitratireducens]|uniref:Sialate O-acetylesterase domain-containing protein n=1 Tax=Thioclava nitratireducens TaxID=1915078 RepID=A0ABM6ICY1_9RHOB|nr:sialate O-acetylesterase [Thioclava nitratireducens]AQS46553.1 hypothetical protein BMG03_01100 [Thioclava nitratireducens]